MAIQRGDEILGKAVPSDSMAVPRYDIVNPDGTRPYQNVQLVLKNPVLQEGMPYNAAVANEILAASGVASGSLNFTLAQPGFALFDGAVVLVKLTAAIGSGQTYTLNINGTGAKGIVTRNNKTTLGTAAANTWQFMVYSASLDKYVIVGDPEYQRMVVIVLDTFTINIPTSGWTYQSEYDRYYVDVYTSSSYVNGGFALVMTINPAVAGPKVPVYGVSFVSGYVRLLATDVPTIATTATIQVQNVVGT